MPYFILSVHILLISRRKSLSPLRNFQTRMSNFAGLWHRFQRTANFAKPTANSAYPMAILASSMMTCTTWKGKHCGLPSPQRNRKYKNIIQFFNGYHLKKYFVKSNRYGNSYRLRAYKSMHFYLPFVEFTYIVLKVSSVEMEVLVLSFAKTFVKLLYVLVFAYIN